MLCRRQRNRGEERAGQAKDAGEADGGALSYERHKMIQWNGRRSVNRGKCACNAAARVRQRIPLGTGLAGQGCCERCCAGCCTGCCAGNLVWDTTSSDASVSKCESTLTAPVSPSCTNVAAPTSETRMS